MDNLFNNIKKLNKHENKQIVETNLNKDEVLAKYNFDYEIDTETQEYLKDVTYKIHILSNNFYTEIGKMLYEANEKLSNNKSGIFIKWADSLGIKKDNAYRYITRYKYIVANRDNINVEQFESLPFSLSVEVAKETVPNEVKEKVINGEIKTIKDFRHELKESKHEEEIQEAEVIEKRSLIGVRKALGEIKTMVGKIDLFSVENDGLLESELKELQEIVERLKKIGR